MFWVYFGLVYRGWVDWQGRWERVWNNGFTHPWGCFFLIPVVVCFLLFIFLQSTLFFWFTIMPFCLFLSISHRNSGNSLSIVMVDGLEYLGLTSLRHVRNGGVLILYNEKLCYLANFDLEPILSSEKQTVSQIKNANNTVCGKLYKRHHYTGYDSILFFMHIYSRLIEKQQQIH